MALAPIDQYRDSLICPRCRARIVIHTGVYACTSGQCQYSRVPFLSISGLPVLVDFDSSILSADHLLRTHGTAQVLREPPRNALKRRLSALLHPPNIQARRHMSQLLERLRQSSSGIRYPVVLVIGGGTIGDGDDEIYSASDVDVVGFDIYRSPTVQFLADAHRIPLADESVDAVVVQAVLEHVLEPITVVDEIYRVLRPDGLVYADTPFMQQVHDGPYDFTRFTESGHRYLFKHFALIDSGAVAGPGTQLAWSIDYLIRALTRSRNAGLITRLCFAWLSVLDRAVDPKFSVDGASSVYFFGRKALHPIEPHDMVAHYGGAQSD